MSAGFQSQQSNNDYTMALQRTTGHIFPARLNYAHAQNAKHISKLCKNLKEPNEARNTIHEVPYILWIQSSDMN